MRQMIIPLILLVASSNLAAMELFGLELLGSSQKQLRAAAKKTGVVLIRDSSESLWFDSYDSSIVLAGSSHLYLGFVRQDQRFAFAEYEFVGFKHEKMLAGLNRKYGSGKMIRGKFISDNEYLWQLDGIKKTFKSDWKNYTTRLSYVSPEALKQLKIEQFNAEREETPKNTTQEFSVY